MQARRTNALSTCFIVNCYGRAAERYVQHLHSSTSGKDTDTVPMAAKAGVSNVAARNIPPPNAKARYQNALTAYNRIPPGIMNVKPGKTKANDSTK